LKDRVRQGGRGGHLQVVPPPASSASHAAAAPAPIQPGSGTRPQTGGQIGATGIITVDLLAELWPQIRQDVKAVNRRIEALLASIDPIRVNGNQIVLAAAYDFHRKRMNEDDVRGVVEDAITRLLGQTVTVQCVMRGDLPSELSVNAGAVGDLTQTQTTEPVQPTQPDAPEVSRNGQTPEQPDVQLEQERDQQRLQAAKNIFDAEEIPS